MITIIGAGPAGSYCAYLLAKAGREVQVFEEHNEIGKPVQCTGIVTAEIKKVLKEVNFDAAIINSSSDVKIVAPNGSSINLKLKEPDIILDRTKFDKLLAEKARAAVAKYYLNSKLIGIKEDRIIVHSNNKIKWIKTDYLIGADGPLTSVGRETGMLGMRSFFFGIQARAELRNENAVEFYPTEDGFAWIVPENKDVVRIGMATTVSNNRDLFHDFLDKKISNRKDIIEIQAGIIPVYNPRQKTMRKRTFLVGDAAGQVKATTAGGIIQGLIGAECLAKAIIENKNYEKLWKGRMGKDLWASLMMRRMMDRFSNSNYNELIRIFNKPENRKILESHGRDKTLMLTVKLAVREPKLLKYGRYLV